MDYKSPTSSGVINRVYNLSDKYVLKIEGEGGVKDEPILKPASEYTEKLRSKGAKVPRILDYHSVDDTDYLLMEKVNGNNLSYDWMSFSDKTRESMIQQLAEQLQIWHSFSYDTFCIPIKSQKFYDSLRPAIERLSNIQLNKVKKNKLPHWFLPYLEILEKFYYENIRDIDEKSSAVLCHTDIHLENIFYKDELLTGIIDLDWISQAPKEYELWKILDTFHAPEYTVEAQLRPQFKDYQMRKELIWLKKYYPKLFSSPDLSRRVCLYYVDPLIESIVDYQNGKWVQDTLQKVTAKVKDFYQNSWIDKILET